MRKVALVMALALTAGAEDLSRQVISLSDTKTLDTAGPGAARNAIRFEASRGAVSVEGWDRPEVEITILKSTTGLFDPKQHDEATRLLSAVQVSAEPMNEAIVISTKIPEHDRKYVRVEYAVKAPRGMKIEVGNHAEGDLSVTGMSGDIEATTRHGQITLDLPGDERYAIDAHTRYGDVYSDFQGQDRRRRLFHHDFTDTAAGGTATGGTAAGGTTAGAEHKLLLRAEIGDIVILKSFAVPAETALTAK
jgi:hypothetical protein